MSSNGRDETTFSKSDPRFGSKHMTDEETPLLSHHSRIPSPEHECEGGNVLVDAAALVDGQGLGPGPGPTAQLDKTVSYPSDGKQYSNDSSEPDGYASPPAGKGSPYLCGISRKRFWVLYSGVLLQYFVACFDSTMMASSHPNITSYFKASDSASWLSTAFFITYLAVQPLYSRLSDFFGRRLIYFFSLSLFTLTNIWCALAQSMQSLILARAFCGLGAGGIIAMGAILTNDLVPMRIRGFYQALVNLAWGSGAAMGAAFGGFLCDTLGWRWTFGVQVPPLLVILIVAVIVTPHGLGPRLAKSDSSKSRWKVVRSFDLAGSFLLTAAVSLLILGLNLGGNILPWSHPFITVALVLSVVAGSALVWVERRAPKPVMPLKLLATKPRGNMVFHQFFTFMGANAMVFNAPLYFQVVNLDSPSMSGFRLVAPTIGYTFCGVASGLIINATGRPKPLIIIGTLISLAGSIAMAALPRHAAVAGATIAVFFPTTGTGLTNPAIAVANLAHSVKEDQAVMSTTQILWRGLGTVMGVAISSLLVQFALPRYLKAYVSGDNREEVITCCMLVCLQGNSLAQVQHAYEDSLRLAFIFILLAFLVALALVTPVHIGRLDHREPEE